MSNIDSTLLNEILDYDPKTGEFVWKVRVNSKVPKGSIAGADHNKGYVHITIKGKKYLAHRLAWFSINKYWPTYIDHINGNRKDNRIENLREVTCSENLHNQRKPRGANPYLGVSKLKNAN